jgi:hypothetical protein
MLIFALFMLATISEYEQEYFNLNKCYNLINWIINNLFRKERYPEVVQKLEHKFATTLEQVLIPFRAVLELYTGESRDKLNIEEGGNSSPNVALGT